MAAHQILETTQARAARIAGAMYLVQMSTAVAGYAVRSSLSVAGDSAATAQKIVGAEGLYRLSIVGDLVTIGAVIVLTWALYVVVRPVNRDLALLGVFFRLIENAILGVIAIALLLGVAVVRRPEYLSTFDGSQLDALARILRLAHSAGFNAGFVFLGLGSAVFAYLLLKSRYIPRILAAWGVVASLLLTACALLIVVFPGAVSALQLVSFAPMGLYEVGLGAWLLVRGARLPSTSG